MMVEFIKRKCRENRDKALKSTTLEDYYLGKQDAYKEMEEYMTAKKTYGVYDEQSHRVFLEAIRDGKYAWGTTQELEKFKANLQKRDRCEIIVNAQGLMRVKER